MKYTVRSDVWWRCTSSSFLLGSQFLVLSPNIWHIFEPPFSFHGLFLAQCSEKATVVLLVGRKDEWKEEEKLTSEQNSDILDKKTSLFIDKVFKRRILHFVLSDTSNFSVEHWGRTQVYQDTDKYTGCRVENLLRSRKDKIKAINITACQKCIQVCTRGANYPAFFMRIKSTIEIILRTNAVAV